jgi:hypothetical protein
MKMAEELGLSNTLILVKNNNAYYEFSDKGFSDNESIGFNCGIEPLSIVNSLDSSFL